ncbi:gliding motility-associated ABC transporter ATP-binding subunit GldA [uncultured Cytophaga sp.]|uniref:gliding motility-associated ABC transporter ATP-binding subunit GldA n=1 Tax=uncultured Cytophaga sp. TaxID=160238 RepID=UPI00260F7F2C|nr:gliding motility-associated ABC transporter ATP-binding subunit GldA [uncultured Cytophaga sp.]
MSVLVKDLVKVYGTQHAVDGISFTANKGQITGFLGPNGAGKSTTMKIATCFIPPTEGTIEVCGYDVIANPLEVRRQIGYLPEHNPLYLDMYVQEYLKFTGGLYGMKGTMLQKRISDMIDLCGLHVEQYKKIGALSKGFRQRVGLAQALLHDPQVLILDEPTTGLDPNQILEIRKVIKTIAKDKTVIFSTHIMQEVQALCDQVIIINKGKIVADKSISEIRNLNASVKIIRLEFTEQVDIYQFSSFEFVSEVKHVQGNVYELFVTTEADTRPIIFKACAEKGWTLIEMKVEEQSLENIFRELTSVK